MKKVGFFAGALAAGLVVFTSAAIAAPVDFGVGDVTKNVIMGTGIGNGSFTGVRAGSIEVGLRGKVRYDSGNIGTDGFGKPSGTYNYDGVRTYTFNQSQFIAPANRSGWNYEWSINTNWDGNSINGIDAFDYLLSIDVNPNPGTSFVIFDPYNVSPVFFDHSFGNNLTAQSAGIEASTLLDFNNYKETYNLSQQSWNLGFLSPVPATALLQSAGIFTIKLDVFEKGTTDVLAGTSIDIIVSAVPLPAALPLFGSGLAILGFMGVRRRRRVAA